MTFADYTTRLATEQMCQIFSEIRLASAHSNAIESSCLFTESSSEERQDQSFWSITHVCRRWRRIAHGDSGLWSQIHLAGDLQGLTYAAYDCRLAAQISLSGSSMLSVTFDGNLPLEMCRRPGFSTLLQSSHRWRDLTIALPGADIIQCRHFLIPRLCDLPSLKTLSICGQEMVTALLICGPINAPNLASLHGPAILARQIKDLGWHSLKHLTVSAPLFTDQLSVGNRPFTLSSLTSISLPSTTPLQTVHVPGIKSLTLYHPKNIQVALDGKLRVMELLDLINRSTLTLMELRLLGILMTSEDADSLFKSTFQLKSLTVSSHNPATTVHVVQTLMNGGLPVLDTLHVWTGGWFCKPLRELRVARPDLQIIHHIA
ncbi:hypothetical protein C8J56DRAFT_1066706 [Mycena floridula]|nr:hypothetical protein C8J56DRAFT_1066706 [Mycena floridula]